MEITNIDSRNRPATLTAYLPCEGKCIGKATRHGFVKAKRLLSSGGRPLHAELFFSCMTCEKQRIWGTSI